MKYLSIFENDGKILEAINDIHLKSKWIDLDCTYSKGVFYKNINQPRIKSDLNPVDGSVIKSDCRDLSFLIEKVNSIVFDPPFLFRNRKSVNNDLICKRFSYFSSFDELKRMYVESLVEFSRKLNKNGYLLFKCQDMNDNKFYCTHNFIINEAEKQGFELKDIIIKRGKSKLQRDAKQQNCVAKIHCYWLVFRLKRIKELEEGVSE